MKEKLISRVGRIISGSVNSVVSAIENAVPETVMEEAILEINEAIDDIRAELGGVIAKKHLANTRLIEENKKHDELTEKINLAVSAQRDDLAESAIAHQLDIEAQIPVLEANISECNSQEKELESYITALQAKKRQMKEELNLYRKSLEEKNGTSGTDKNNGDASSVSVENRVSKADAAFERVLEKATGIPTANKAANMKDAANLAELEKMARKNRIQERLMAIKGNTKDKSE